MGSVDLNKIEELAKEACGTTWGYRPDKTLYSNLSPEVVLAMIRVVKAAKELFRGPAQPFGPVIDSLKKSLTPFQTKETP